MTAERGRQLAGACHDLADGGHGRQAEDPFLQVDHDEGGDDIECGQRHGPLPDYGSTRRLMISPAANSVSRSRSSSCETARVSQVHLASLALFRTAAPLAVRSMLTCRPSVG